MKRVLKFLFYLLLSFLIFLILFFYIYNQSVKSNLKKFEIDVNNKWSECYLYSSGKVKSTKEFIDSQVYIIPNRNEIILTIEQNLRDRNKYSTGCNLEFVELEYNLNKELMILLDSTNVNSGKYKSFEKVFITSNDKLNALIEEYNNTTLSYNLYISTFPNFIIAKRNGFKRKKFFEIKYGINNEDPIEKNKKLQEWIKGVDTTL
ncbi:MAG TPA: LemA family protein [Candidatus Paceibacterota bacterium]